MIFGPALEKQVIECGKTLAMETLKSEDKKRVLPSWMTDPVNERKVVSVKTAAKRKQTAAVRVGAATRWDSLRSGDFSVALLACHSGQGNEVGHSSSALRSQLAPPREAPGECSVGELCAGEVLPSCCWCRQRAQYTNHAPRSQLFKVPIFSSFVTKARSMDLKSSHPSGTCLSCAQSFSVSQAI